MTGSQPGSTDPPTLGALLEEAAQRWPASPALETAADRVWRYEELTAAVDTAARLLVAHGAVPGDRIAVALPQGAALFAVPFVASRLGVSALLLSTALSPAQWRWQLRTARPRLVLCDAGHAGDLAGCGAPVVEIDPDDPAFGAPHDAAPLTHVGGHAPGSTVLYVGTSGTTGMPKLTCLTEGGLLHAARSYLPRIPLEEGERSLVVMPLYYIGPLTAQSVLMPMVGGCNVIAEDPRPGPVAARLASDPITHLDAVPAWLTRLAARITRPPRSWRSVIYGGAPMPHGAATALARSAADLGLYDVWGLSEAHGPVTMLRFRPDAPQEPGVVGTPMDGIVVRAVPDGQTPDAGQPSDAAVGELWITGPTITPGYLHDPQATSEALHEGWLATGDLGVVDADGTVRLLGRRKDVILRGGANVFSIQVEQVLTTVDGVAEAAVFPVPSETAGEVVGAAIVPGEGEVDVGALRRAVRVRIGPHAVPRHIRTVEALPRNATGKVDKPALMRMVDADTAEPVADRREDPSEDTRPPPR